MKTPEEIKKGLKFCTREHHSADPLCGSCPYDDGGFDMVACTGSLSQDALAYIRQLEQELAAVKRERDAAVLDLKRHVLRSRKTCLLCANRNKPICNQCEGCDVFKWRGVCAENTEVSPDA